MSVGIAPGFPSQQKSFPAHPPSGPFPRVVPSPSPLPPLVQCLRPRPGHRFRDGPRDDRPPPLCVPCPVPPAKAQGTPRTLKCCWFCVLNPNAKSFASNVSPTSSPAASASSKHPFHYTHMTSLHFPPDPPAANSKLDCFSSLKAADGSF